MGWQNSDGALVSVIVTTRNEADTIVGCLTSIREQTYSPIETVVVDNGSTDGTAQLAAKNADIVFQFGPERSAQRNEGARRSHGSFLFFVDADMELEPAVITQAVAAAAAGATGVIVPETSIGVGIWSAAKALERSCYLGDDTIEAARFFSREAFVRHEGYDESLTGPEDWDLPGRMRATESIARVEAKIVHHEGRITLSELMRKKFYYGRSFGRYLRKHPGLASRQLTVFRPAFAREWRSLARAPIVAIVMLFMKLSEFAAGAAGLLTDIAERNVRLPRHKRPPG